VGIFDRVLGAWRQYQFSKKHIIDVGDIWVRLVAVNCAIRARFGILPDENIERQESGGYREVVGKFRQVAGLERVARDSCAFASDALVISGYQSVPGVIVELPRVNTRRDGNRIAGHFFTMGHEVLRPSEVVVYRERRIASSGSPSTSRNMRNCPPCATRRS
jgi:hypothetical protein